MPTEKSVDTIAMELTEKAITRLLSMIRDGETNVIELVEDKVSDVVYLDLIRQFFERLELTIPQSILSGEPSVIEVEHSLVGKKVMICASYTPSSNIHYILSSKII